MSKLFEFKVPYTQQEIEALPVHKAVKLALDDMVNNPKSWGKVELCGVHPLQLYLENKSVSININFPTNGLRSSATFGRCRDGRTMVVVSIDDDLLKVLETVFKDAFQAGKAEKEKYDQTGLDDLESLFTGLGKPVPKGSLDEQEAPQIAPPRPVNRPRDGRVANPFAVPERAVVEVPVLPADLARRQAEIWEEINRIERGPEVG